MNKMVLMTEEDYRAALKEAVYQGAKQALAEAGKFEDLLTEREVRVILKATQAKRFGEILRLNNFPVPIKRIGRVNMCRLSQFPKTL